MTARFHDLLACALCNGLVVAGGVAWFTCARSDTAAMCFSVAAFVAVGALHVKLDKLFDQRRRA